MEAVRQAEGFPVRYTRLTPEHILAHACRDITLQPTTTLQFELAASEDAARLGIRTLLSGWGGDELAGLQRARLFPGPAARRALAHPAARAFPARPAPRRRRLEAVDFLCLLSFASHPHLAPPEAG